MPKVIGRTEDGRDILREEPSEGCRWRCVSCGAPLRGRREVRAHWALFSRGHSLFTDKNDVTHHCTIEGLFERKQR